MIQIVYALGSFCLNQNQNQNKIYCHVCLLKHTRNFGDLRKKLNINMCGHKKQDSQNMHVIYTDTIMQGNVNNKGEIQ